MRAIVIVGENTIMVPLLLLASYLAEVPSVHLPGENVSAVALASGSVYARTEAGWLRREGGEWRPASAPPPTPSVKPPAGFQPRDGDRSWAPHEVRGTARDTRGRFWFASPQGVGSFDGRAWKLYTGYEGLPYNDFTTVAAGEDGVVWFGTTRGAIRFDGTNWEYRQGRRWLPDDHVQGIAVTPEGHAWIATPKGLGLIERRPSTLAEKAAFFEAEIDRRHRRTPYGYVLSVSLKRPGDKSEWTQHDSDNDGLWTGMYGAGECFAYAATKDPAAKRRARAAFEALRFLSTVTQGGSHPAPPGFPARSILPTSGPDPNRVYTRQRDEERRARDPLWKILQPRWPTSADGQWYWKTDTSSDELDGHYFLYAQYYDLVAETEAEKEDVRRVVRAVTDHLLSHNYTLVDWDGTPTRWAVFSPDKLNQDPEWWEERGLNSLSMLSYLKVAEHLTGDPKYRQAYERLIRDHHYAVNLLVPKIAHGIGSGNQSDDEMAFMSFYNLIRYETDSARRSLYCSSFTRYWQMERMELNPLFHFLWAASCGERNGPWLDESLDTLRRFPTDRIDWGLANSHRQDLVPLGNGRGYRRNGQVLPIDERHLEYWNADPFRLDYAGQGLRLADGAAFLLPYYLGLYHKFLSK
jgi:hypothetical protein